MRRRFWVLLAVWLCLPGGAVKAGVMLPLEGYCKPGKFFPIKVDGEEARHIQWFSAEHCVPSQMEASVQGRAMIPMLAVGEARELRWAGGTLVLHAVEADECLVGEIADESTQIAGVFPGKKILPIQLDAADLLPGPAVGWETLDGIALEASQMGRVSDAQRSTLLAGGVKLIAIGANRPDPSWPWQKVGSVWVLSASLHGPVGEVVNVNVYAPILGWTPGWSAVIRGQVVGIGGLLVMITVAVLLIPRRWAVWVAIGVSLLTATGVVFWRHALGSVDRAGGDILIAGQGLVQRDAYVYEKARESSIQSVSWAGWTHPIFASNLGLKSSAMSVGVSTDGRLTFNYQATAGHTLAFVRREIQPGNLTAGAAGGAGGSPMEDAVKAEYLGAGDRIVGETVGVNGRWGRVMIQRK